MVAPLNKRIIITSSFKTQVDTGRLSEVERLATAMNKVERAGAKTSSTFGTVRSDVTRLRIAYFNFAVIAGVAGIAMGALIKPAIELETRMVGVAKTTGLSRIEIANLKEELIGLSTQLPISVNDLADIAKVAGQLGIAKEDIGEFTDTIAHIATVTDMTAQEAATNFAQLANAFDLPIQRVMVMGNVINELENTTAATSTGIVKSLTRVGAAATNLGFDFEQTTAAVATLISAGLGIERSGTRLRALFTKMGQDVESFADIANLGVGEFRDLMEEDVNKALLSVLDGLQATESNTQRMADAFDAAGRVGGFALLTLANNADEFRKNLETANTQMALNNSVILEMNKFLEATSSQWIIFKNLLIADSITIGDSFNEHLIKPMLDFLITLRTGENGYTIVTRSQNKLTDAFSRGLITMQQYSSIMFEVDKLFRSGFDERIIGQTFDKLITDTIALNDSQGLLEDSTGILVDKYKNLGEALNAYSIARKDVTNAEETSIKNYSKMSQRLEDVKDKIKDSFGEETLGVVESYFKAQEKLNVATEKAAGATDQYKSQLADLRDRLKEVGKDLSKVRSEISEITSTISNIKSRRFIIGGISETGIIDLIKQQELEMKRAEFSALGLGSAEDFLRNATLITSESIDDQTSALMRLTDAASDGSNAFDAWKTTLTETIRSLLINSQDLDKDVTDVVKNLQTQLLSISEFRGAEGGFGSVMEQQLDQLGLAQDIFFGGEREKLQASERAYEDKTNGVNVSAEAAISALAGERAALEGLREEEENLIETQDNLKNNIDELITKIRELEEQANKTTDAMSRMGEIGGRGRDISVTGGRFGVGAISTVAGAFTSLGPGVAERFKEAQSRFNIPALAEGGLVEKPTLALVGEEGPEMVIPMNKMNGIGGTTNNIQITVSGADKDPKEIAREIRQELVSIR